MVLQVESVFSQNTTVVLLFSKKIFLVGGGGLMSVSLVTSASLECLFSLAQEQLTPVETRRRESAAQLIADYPEILLVYTIPMVTVATLTG